MPIPKPTDSDDQDSFVSRCMSNDTMVEEYPDNDQRLAICFEAWRNRNKEAAMELERKSIQIELKEDKEGSFIARIAKLNVVDLDNDVTLTGAFPVSKEVVISAYQHGSWMGELPVGRAIIKESGQEVLAEGEFNLNTVTGKEHYESVKFSGPLQEWSYGFKALEFEFGEQDEKEVRFLKKVDPFEISPVMKGAGKDTRTLAIKNNVEGIPYAEQAEAVLAAVEALSVRTKSLAELRRKEGRILSESHRGQMKELQSSLSEVAANLKDLIDNIEPVDTALAEKLMREFTKLDFEITEVSVK